MNRNWQAQAVRLLRRALAVALAALVISGATYALSLTPASTALTSVLAAGRGGPPNRQPAANATTSASPPAPAGNQAPAGPGITPPPEPAGRSSRPVLQLLGPAWPPVDQPAPPPTRARCGSATSSFAGSIAAISFSQRSVRCGSHCLPRPRWNCSITISSGSALR